MKEPLQFDIIVAGGGPAGIAGAITAARSGARVLLVERGRYPRQKVCGEFISAESLGLLGSLFAELPEAKDALARAPRIERARVFVGEQSFEAPVAPAAASLARYDLDAMLWQAAQKAGVHAREQAEVIGARSPRTMLDANHEQTKLYGQTLRLRLNGTVSEISARAVINAAGRSSRLAPQASGERWIGLKAHFRVGSDAQLTTDLYCFRGGYCGVQPVRCGGETLINACALVHADSARTIEEVLAADPHLRETSRAWEKACDTVTTGAVSFRDPQTERDGAFLAGDAAGFIDPFVGDGIAIALRSGAMAGEITARVVRGEVTLEEAHRTYAQRYHAAFDGAFRNARRLRRMLELPSIPRAALMALMKVPGVAGLAVKATRST